MGSYAISQSVRRLSVVDEGPGENDDGVSPIEYSSPHDLVFRPQTSSSSVYSTNDVNKYVSNAVREVGTIPSVVPESPAFRNSDESSQQPLPKWIERLGWYSLAVLVIALLVIVGSVLFLSFLWFAKHENDNWRTIILQGWANQAVSISALLIRNATDFQIGIAVAMLASLALESYGVRLFDAAGVSMMRAGNSTPWTLVLPMLRGSSLKLESITYLIPALTLLIVAIALQFTSTVLLSDLQLGILPSSRTLSTLAYDYSIITEEDYDNYFPTTKHVGTWLRNPTAFPTYAEYYEEGLVKEARISSIDDTGPLIRGFLPFSDSSAREKLNEYQGNALLLDARVMCVAPDFGDLSWSFSGLGANNVTGTVKPAIDIPDHRFLAPNASFSFFCPMEPETSGSDLFSICQITDDPVAGDDQWVTFAGGLLSRFTNATSDVPRTQPWYWELTRQWGRRFLVIHTQNNVTTASTESSAYRTGNWSAVRNGTGSVQDGQWTKVPSMTLDQWSFRFSLCYSAWNSASLPVYMAGYTNRTEPQLRYDQPPDRNSSRCPHNTCWNFTSVLQQTNSWYNWTTNKYTDGYVWPPDRGLLWLSEARSWVPDYNNRSLFGYSWVRDMADMGGKNSNAANFSTFISYDGEVGQGVYFNSEQAQWADPILGMLFLKAIETTGSLAHALSTLITTVSSMVYYDQLPQFTASSDVEHAYFVTVQYPHGIRGFLGVVIVLGVHTITVTIITILFLVRTRFTLLDNSWMCVAQLIRPEVDEMLKGRSVVKDDVVEKELEKHGAKEKRVGLGRGTDGVRVRFSSERANTW